MDSLDQEPQSDRPSKFTLELEADRMKCPSNTVVLMLILMLILDNSSLFLIHPDTVELTISLRFS